MRKITFTILLSFVTLLSFAQKIDRCEVVTRNNPYINHIDTLGSLTVGNGHFCTTVDVTGLQSFPESYQNGVPLCAMSDWGWHAFPNTKNLKPEDTQKTMDLSHGHKEVYAVEYKTAGKNKDATEYFRVNPHRLNLGNIGFVFNDGNTTASLSDIQSIQQTLNLYDGNIHSQYNVFDTPVQVTTAALTDCSAVVFSATSKLFQKGSAKIALRLPYVTGKHADWATDFGHYDKHLSKIIAQGKNYAIIEHRIDTTLYYACLSWQGKATLIPDEAHHTYTLTPSSATISVKLEYSPSIEKSRAFDFNKSLSSVTSFWRNWWSKGAIVDFSQCTDPRAQELERRTVLSQYLTYINCANDTPPQETGLTYNSWYGRPHLEMTWWHLVDFSLWNRPEVMERILNWYTDVAYPYAKQIAQRQGFSGVRWMKMTDPWVGESPSNVGSFLTWQQPHYIYMAEELYRRAQENNADTMGVLSCYGKCVEETAEFLYDFARSCGQKTGEIRLYGQTAMQESMSKDFSFSQPFEQAYFVYGLTTAQKWRERQGKERNHDWDVIIRHMAPLPDHDGIYTAGMPTQPFLCDSTVNESAPSLLGRAGGEAFDPFNTGNTTSTKQLTKEEFYQKCCSDHPAVLGACGLLPDYGLYDRAEMQRTLSWVMDNWNWATTWGWDYGMTAMCAARLGDTENAIRALLIDKGKNTYLVSGHNYQEPKRLRLYLPGNGALLDAVAMMCAGWDGCSDIPNPGFPQNGKWNVRWEGLNRMQ